MAIYRHLKKVSQPKHFSGCFLRERCLDAWAKIGSATSTGEITRACLSDKQVMREMGDVDADDDKDRLHWKVQTANTLAVDALVRVGYNGELLCTTLKPKRDDERLITQPRTNHTSEDKGKVGTSFSGEECGTTSHGNRWVPSDPQRHAHIN
jgi:hypothetical protein